MGVAHAFEPLSETVEDRLVRRMNGGDRDARRRSIESYLGLVATIARRHARWGVPLEDLFQEGALALVQAVDRYDPGKGMRLSTYATWWVKRAIRRVAMAQSTPVRIPERRRELGLEGLARRSPPHKHARTGKGWPRRTAAR